MLQRIICRVAAITHCSITYIRIIAASSSSFGITRLNAISHYDDWPKIPMSGVYLYSTVDAIRNNCIPPHYTVASCNSCMSFLCFVHGMFRNYSISAYYIPDIVQVQNTFIVSFPSKCGLCIVHIFACKINNIYE